MRKVLFLLLFLLMPLWAANHVSELNKMAGRKITVTYRFYDKTVEGELKEVNDSGIVIYVNGSERLFLFYDAIASIQEQRRN